MPNLYSVRNWNKLFENNRTRELKKLDWVPIPNKQDGDGYSELICMEDGPALFGTWIVLVQIASKCSPRGRLCRDDGSPHTSQSLARMSRVPAGLIDKAFLVLSGIRWLESESYEIPHPPAGIPHPSEIALTGREGKGRECTEENGMEVNGSVAHDAIDLCNYIQDQIRVAFKQPDRPMSYMEQQQLAEIAKRPRVRDELIMLLAYRQQTDYFPKSVTSLLEKWGKTVDEAGSHTPKSSDSKQRQENITAPRL